MRALLILLGVGLVLSTLCFVYLLSQNPFEFVGSGCDPGPVEDWYAVLRSGCVDAGYAGGFILTYGAILCALLLTARWLIRWLGRRDS